jgi:hypothetical protein
MKRCYKCGRIKCETCGGQGWFSWCPECGSFADRCLSAEHSMYEVRDCPDCKDGWREAEECPFAKGKRFCRYFPDCSDDFWCEQDDRRHIMRGADRAILCPKCEEAA